MFRLIFSQSLESLSLIQRMLSTQSKTWFDDHEPLKRSSEKWGWELGKDFFVSRLFIKYMFSFGLLCVIRSL